MVEITWPRCLHYLYMVKTLKDFLLQNQEIWHLETWYIASMTQGPTKFVQMMILSWQLTFLRKGQIDIPTCMHFPFADSRREVVSYLQKNLHWVLVNRLLGLSLPKKKCGLVNWSSRHDYSCWPCPYGENPLKIFSRTKKQGILKLGIKHWQLKVYQICSNDDPKWTFDLSTKRSVGLSSAFIWEKYW